MLLFVMMGLAVTQTEFRLVHQYRTPDSVDSKQQHTFEFEGSELKLAIVLCTFESRENSEQSLNKFSVPLCVASTYDDLRFEQLQFNKARDELKAFQSDSTKLNFDYQASLTNSDTHLIQFKWNPELPLHFLFGDYQDPTANFRLEIEVFLKDYDEMEAACVNSCQSTRVGVQKSAYRTCSDNRCLCGFRHFGAYCQYEKEAVSLGTQVNMLLRPQRWQYLSYNLDTQTEDKVFFEVENLKVEMIVSFGFNGLAGYDVPSLVQNQYKIPASDTKHTYAFESYISHYRKLIDVLKVPPTHEIYLGLFNPSPRTIQFSVRFMLQNQGGFVEFLKQNYILMIFLVVNFVLSIIFMCYNRSRPPQNLTQQPNPQSRQVRRRKVVKGFRKEFIELYFRPYQFDDLLLTYPLLKEQEECVICLEPMKIIENDQFVCCSLTPCFHMYHHECLKKWFMCQKYCPICREKFTEVKIRKRKQWVNISVTGTPQASSDRQNRSAYVQRIKKSKVHLVEESAIGLHESSDQILDQTIPDPHSVSFDEESKHPGNILPPQ